MAKKNKMKPRELREAQKKARQLKAAEINNNAAPAIAAMPAAEVIAPAAEKKKSSVKAAGMKSIFVSENKMYITSFGKGNSAVLEYEVDKVDNDNYNKTQLSSEDSSNIELRGVNEVNITFSSKHGFESGVEINTSNPTHRSGESSPVRWDMLGLKSELEKRFFGKTFDDNIHIQLIYNILDIEKILAVYVTNIVYALNNMLGVKGSESHDDFIGYLSTNNIYDVFIDPDNSSLSDDKKANVRKSLSKFNALLKTLEEPPEYAVIMLLTSNVNSLLPTILSRCVVLNMKPVADELVRNYLMHQLQVPDYKAEVCVAFARGNIGKAKSLASSEDFDNIKNEALSLLKYIQDMDLSEITAAIKKITEYKLQINDYLDLIAIWYRDVLLFKATSDVNHLVFREEISAIRRVAQRSSYEGIEEVIEALDKAKRRLDANVNFELTMELLMLEIKENG